MRNNTGVSNINRRKFVAKAKISERINLTEKPAELEQRIIDATGEVSTNRLVTVSPNVIQDGRPQSTDITGNTIDVDEEGRMSLDPIKKMDVVSQTVRGLFVPTEQMAGIVKDVAYGVASEDQRMMESGLDLVINPLLKPYTDERMKTEGVISEEWYWPEELKNSWNVLPAFMQPSDRIEKRSLIEGIGANVGNIGAISQAPLAGRIRDKEFAVSADRFTQAPGYYIGSAIGEVPYFLIGAGQVKAVGTIAAKATAGAARGGLTGKTGLKVIAVAYKIERATEKLQKVSNRLNTGKLLTKVVSRPEVLKAVDLLKKGYAKNTDVQKKGIAKNQKLIDDPDIDTAKRIELEEINKELQETINKNSENYTRIDEKFGNTKINKLDNMKTGTKESIDKKAIDIDEFNTQVQTDLLPEMRKFKDGYLAHATKVAKGSKTEKFAQLIEGSPSNLSNKLDKFFNQPGKNLGDSDIADSDILNIQRRQIEKDVDAGKYSGVMGSIKLNNVLYGGAFKTALGINRAQAKLNDFASVISKTFPTLRVINREQFLTLDKSMVKERAKLEKQKKLEIKYKAGEEKVTETQSMIDAINKTLDANKKTKLQLIAHKGYKKKGSDQSNKEVEYVYDYNVLQQVYPKLAEKIIPKEILFGARPSVNIEKRHGIMMGTIGDALSGTKETIGGKTYWFGDKARNEAITTYGEAYLTKNPSWTKKIGLRKIGRYQTLIPKRVQAKEKIMYWYEANDDLLATSGVKSGVRPVVFLDKGTNLSDLYLFKKQHHLRDFTGDTSVSDTFGKDKILLEYDDISMDQIKKIQPDIVTDENKWSKTFGKTIIKYGDAEQIKDMDLDVILKNRATLENRPDVARGFAEIELSRLSKPIKQLHIQYAKDAQRIKTSPWYKSEPNRVKATEKNKKMYDTKIKQAEASRDQKIERMNMNQDDLRNMNIRLQSYSTSNPKGTVTSTPWANVLKQKKMLESKYEADQVIDRKTGKQYYVAGDKWYEVIDTDNFNVSMITKYDSVKHNRSNRVYAGGKYRDEDTGELVGNYYEEDILKTDSTMGLGEIAGKQRSSETNFIDPKTGKDSNLPEGIIPPEDKSGATKSSSLGNMKSSSGKSSMDKSILGDIDKMTSENTIFLNADPSKELLRGMLSPVSAEEKSMLLSGSTFGKAISKKQADIAAVDQSSPSIIKTTDPDVPGVPKKTTRQLIEQNVAITLGKFQVSKISSLSETKIKLTEALVGERFSFVPSRSFAPDPTITGRQGSLYGDMAKGDSIIIAGADDPWRRMIMSTQHPAITQPGIPGGVKVVPMYDSSTVAHIIDETISNKMELHQGKGLQSNKGTNYEQLMEIAERQDNVDAFKDRMIDLVYMKIKKEDTPKQQIRTQLMEKDSSLYQKEIIDVVSTPNNEFLRDLNFKDKIALGKKNKKTGKKEAIISPREDFKNVLDGDISIDTRNPLKRLVDARRFRSIETDSEYGFQGDRSIDIYNTSGKIIGQRDFLDRILLAAQRRKGRKSKIMVEPDNPFMRAGMKKVFNDPLFLNLIQGNKKWKGVKETIDSMGETPTDRSLKAVLEGEQEVRREAVSTKKKLPTWSYGKDVNKAEVDKMEKRMSKLDDTSNRIMGSTQDDIFELTEDIKDLQLKQQDLLKVKQNNSNKWTNAKDNELKQVKWDMVEKRNELKKVKLTEAGIKDSVTWKSVQSKSSELLKKIQTAKDERVYKYSVKNKLTGKTRIVKSKGEATRMIFKDGYMDVTTKEVGRKNPTTDKMWDWSQLSQPFKLKLDIIDNKGKVQFKAGTRYARGAPTDNDPLVFTGSRTEAKDTLDKTVALLRKSIFDDIGLPLDSTTSLGRSKLGKSLSESMTKVFRQEQTKAVTQNRKAVEQNKKPTANVFKTLEDFLESSEASNAVNTPGFMERMNKWDSQIKLMDDITDKTAEKLSDSPRINAFSPDQIMNKVSQSQKRDNTVGLGTQLVSGLSPASTVASNISTKTSMLSDSSQAPQPDGFGISFGQQAYAEPFIPTKQMVQPKNVLDQTIGDIQKTMSGMTSGTERISQAKDGVGVKSYQMSESLNIFDTSSSSGELGKITIPKMQGSLDSTLSSQIQPQRQTPNLLEGLNLGSKEDYGSVMITPRKGMLDEITNIAQTQRVLPAQFQAGAQIADKPLFAVPPLVTPKPIGPRIVPATPFIPIFNPVNAAIQRRRAKPPKSKKKKTWWQTPENWYEPYYWGGKNQEGAGYVTFTGKEPAKVKKYEKKFFGIGVNDSPFNVRSKWF